MVSPLAAQAADLQWKVSKNGRIEKKQVEVRNKKTVGAVSIFEPFYEYEHEHERVGFERKNLSTFLRTTADLERWPRKPRAWRLRATSCRLTAPLRDHATPMDVLQSAKEQRSL